MASENDVVLVFPSSAPSPVGSTGSAMRGMLGDEMKEISVRVADVANWFKDFDIDSIQITISAGVETGGITKLFVSAKGEGGFTMTLKPKKPGH